MALIGSWNGFRFEVSPTVVRGFTGLTIKGGSETEDKVSEKQKYVQRMNSAATEISLSVYLNAYIGCNVRDEANGFITAAMEGAQNYFYVGGKKLVVCKLMLVQAEIAEIELAPSGAWIACKINLTMKQCEKQEGLSGSTGNAGSSGGGQSSKQTVKQESVFSHAINVAQEVVTNVAEIASGLAEKMRDKVKGTSSAATPSSAETYTQKKAAEALKAQTAGKSATKAMGKTLGGGSSRITAVAAR